MRGSAGGFFAGVVAMAALSATTALVAGARRWHEIEAARGAADARARRQGERYAKCWGASAGKAGPRRPEASVARCEASDARGRGREPSGLGHVTSLQLLADSDQRTTRRHARPLTRRTKAREGLHESAPTLRRDGLPEKARALTPRQPCIAPRRGQPPRAEKAALRCAPRHHTR